jgi:hypothetical protein
MNIQMTREVVGVFVRFSLRRFVKEQFVETDQNNKFKFIKGYFSIGGIGEDISTFALKKLLGKINTFLTVTNLTVTEEELCFIRNYRYKL